MKIGVLALAIGLILLGFGISTGGRGGQITISAYLVGLVLTSLGLARASPRSVIA